MYMFDAIIPFKKIMVCIIQKQKYNHAGRKNKINDPSPPKKVIKKIKNKFQTNKLKYHLNRPPPQQNKTNVLAVP